MTLRFEQNEAQIKLGTHRSQIRIWAIAHTYRCRDLEPMDNARKGNVSECPFHDLRVRGWL